MNFCSQLKIVDWSGFNHG
ncbi:MAG: hypothetical protein EWV76_11185 [Microcystis novacekii Mn_MB_F_20050700_S1]|uniref:Uncharacterized protein n=1 Tax=Microcystis novacekii Mn_MB_F_20050700_S1D TaxID=2486266 RepID=A0A552JAG0_9CHRO|nr:MAG: hypothetical protein EWV76_11185 [Microcystis novacekii Mn_MB_F_20050700_S1]TRU92637.1 MAG: hypothetical protein EWV54_02470 [Microcystis novacekii Mn_MB_F_20050700_S1D]